LSDFDSLNNSENVPLVNDRLAKLQMNGAKMSLHALFSDIKIIKSSGNVFSRHCLKNVIIRYVHTGNK